MASMINKGGAQFFKPFIREKSNQGLTALAGGGQSGATLLSAGINVITTVANANDSVMLPAVTLATSGYFKTPALGAAITVINLGANPVAVFPASGDAINGGSANASIVLTPLAVITFSAGRIVSGAGQWYMGAQNGVLASGQPQVGIVNLAGAAWHTGNGTANVLSFTNPSAAAIVVMDVTIYEATASTGAATVAAGTTTVNNHTASDNLIDDYNLQTSAPNAYSTYSKTDTEVPAQQLAAGGWVTFTASADPTGFVGSAYIHYFAI